MRIPGITLNIFAFLSFAFAALSLAQDDDIDLGDVVLPERRLPLCFGSRNIGEAEALAICDALSLGENVRARELGEQWVRSMPDSAAAQFSLAEVLLTVEGNMPRALFHLNRAEQLTAYATIEEALEAGNLYWYFLILSQLGNVQQLMGEQHKSLEYLDRIEEVFGEDMESFRGWPLIKLQEYELARASANRVLQTTDDRLARSRAWNTLCAVELASLAPVDTSSACDKAISEEGDFNDYVSDYDTVYLTNASEVSLSLLEIDQAESYLDRATNHLNPDSVADPWIYKLYLTLNQGRFDESRNALRRMIQWRGQQEPLVSVMNQAEHFLVSASFLMIAGYAEDAAKLTLTSLNQPDRNGSYSADDAQKDAYAALLNRMAIRTEIEIQKEQRATMGLVEAMGHRLATASLGLQAWRSERHAAAAFADYEVLQNRVRPYAPLDVHIPEWVEPEIVSLIGAGVMSAVLEQARANGAFQLNDGYYYSYLNEIAAVGNNATAAVNAGQQALTLLPAAEVLLRARIAANTATALWRLGHREQALRQYHHAYSQDPSIIRRLGLALPATLVSDGGRDAEKAAQFLRNSPRFDLAEAGFILDISSTPELSICLRTASGDELSCYSLAEAQSAGSEALAKNLVAKDLVNGFHAHAFGLGYDISRAERSFLLGSSVYLNPQSTANQQRSKDDFQSR